ncbi:hypothetical protein [Pseudomonas aeruginosa]|uniref:hypothetical protein n=1 Tax=Pseudomonas aeruginosa TaxID=287 RepID=UPI0021B460C0|nr:hypothetical protein [Pseudomonas aeruginosa]MCT7418360.1 hypothetical protein [Pseudomonas aeruginosa]
MKSGFDFYFGGRVSSRQEIWQQRLRNLRTEGSVMNDLEKVLSSRTPAEQVQAAEDFNKANRSKLISSKKGTLYLGDVFE